MYLVENHEFISRLKLEIYELEMISLVSKSGRERYLACITGMRNGQLTNMLFVYSYGEATRLRYLTVMESLSKKDS
jgi:hypothetical protein